MAEVTMVKRQYSGFRGVDFRGEEINLMRSPDALNMWRDYTAADGICTRPSMHSVQHYSGVIYGIFFLGEDMLVHAGTSLYKGSSVLYEGMNEARSSSFVFGNILYIKDGKNYIQYNGQTATDVVGYIPITSDEAEEDGVVGRRVFQEVNLLSDYRINTFVADGEKTEYYLDSEGIDSDHIPEVKLNGTVMETDVYTVTPSGGKITFDVAPPAPASGGENNLEIKYKKTVAGYRDKVLKSTLLQVFDNRVFFAGNPEEPNTVRHCSLYAPNYVGDTDYYDEGLDEAAIRGMVAGNNALWVFREPSDANTSIFYHIPTLDADGVKIYPSTHSSVTTGCIGRAVNFNDDIVFFSERGMEGINGDITTEQVVAHRSTTVDAKLIREEDYGNMILVEWNGYLLVIIGKKIYAADSRTAFQVESHMEYDWFYWEMEHEITAANVHGGVLHLGCAIVAEDVTEYGTFTLTGAEDVVSHWTTPKDKFGYPSMQKTTNKRGCVVEATGDVAVSAKTDKTGFERIVGAEGVTDHLVCRIKRKKFKDIQLKFSSDTRFALESATLECFVGGYIKR